jgi:Zn-dependent protease with chaperone function
MIAFMSQYIKLFNACQHLFAHFLPSSMAYSNRTNFTNEEKIKYDRIRSIVLEVGKNTGIANLDRVNFRVTKEVSDNACMMGSTLSFGGPVMCLANNYFSNFESPQVMRDPEYCEWRQLLSELPDDPEKLGTYLDACSLKKWGQIFLLSRKFNSVLTSDELKGMIAHELGHAKHFHGLVHVVALTLLGLAGLKFEEFSQPYLGFCSTIASLGFVYAGFLYVSKSSEREADEETSASLSYALGLKDFFKKELIKELTRKRSASSHVKESLAEIGWFRSHPTHAQRVHAAMKRIQNGDRFSPRSVSLFKRALAASGALILIGQVAQAVSLIWPGTKTEEKKKTNPLPLHV